MGSIIWLLFSTFSLFGQNDAMQFNYAISSTGEENEGSLAFIVSKSGSMIMRPELSDNSTFTIETYIEDIHDSGSKQTMLFGRKGALVHFTGILGFECDHKSSKEDAILIEKNGKNSLRLLQADSTELIFHFSDENKYQDYRLFVAKGMFGNSFTIPIPESIQTRSDKNNYTLKLVRTKERKWTEVMENFSARSADARKVPPEELCELLGVGSTLGF